MRSKKRWLAAALSIVIAFGDCGGMTSLATESSLNAENTVSENNTLSDEMPEIEDGENEDDDTLSDSSADPDAPEETNILPDADDGDETDGAEEIKEAEEADPETDLPALHIGRIAEGESLPDAGDDTFIYDLPLSFETAKNLILFASYDIAEIPETAEAGTLVWSILRGEKGLEAGSANLLDEEDDWNGFEEVSSSPFFALEEITDAESEYYRMMALIPEEGFSAGTGSENHKAEETSENYAYYIRAAYYTEAAAKNDGDFYAATTVPFVPGEDTAADGETDEITENAADTVKNPEDAAPEEASVSENSADEIENALSEDGPIETDALHEDESGSPESSEDPNTENDLTDETAETLSTVSENSSIQGASALAEDAELPPLEEEPDGRLALYKGAGTDEADIIDAKERITLGSGDTQQITAKADPEMEPTAFLWESSDETVATVTAGENGTATITGASEGYARITVSCRSITASVVVDVVLDKENPDNDKHLDLSGDIRVAGFEKENDRLVYNGQKITQNFRVYHKDTLLKEKTDYTLSYKNNVNAAAWNSAKAPSVTINLKGQYQGSVTLYYTIKPLDINDIDIYNPDITVPGEDGTGVKKTPGYEQTVNYSKKLNIPAPVLTFGKKKLVVKKDFICDYTTPGENMTALPSDYKNGSLYEPGKAYSYTVLGTGNFTGSFPMQLVVLNDKTRNFSSASVKLDKRQYAYSGAPLSKADVLIEEVKISGLVLDKALYDYEVCASGTEGAYLMLSPTDAGRNAGYRGCKKVTLKLVGDRMIRDAVPGADWHENLPFSQKTVDKDGGIFQTSPALLTFGEGTGKETLSEGTDYTVKYSNAKKAGRVTATFTGKGRYKGTLRLTYTITPNTDLKIVMGKNVTNNNGTYEVAYQKGGAVPELILKDQDYTVLKIKTDYTIKYKDNKTPGEPMTCEITGKGSYKGYERTVTLMVTKADIGKCTISIPDKPCSDKPNKWKSTVTIKDVNGKKLAAKTDYDANFTFSHTQEQSPPQDTTIEVTVRGLGCYEGSSIKGSYRIFAKNISTLKVVIDPQEYTGEEITLTPVTDIHLYANSTDAKKKQNEITKSCYEIEEYTNNIKAGTARVTLRGIGEYGGTKNYSFKIQKKKYQINRVKGIQLDKTSQSITLAETDTEKRTLTATVTSEIDEKIANPTVIWTSSNNNIATIEEIPDSTVSGSADKKQTASVSAILTLKKEGSVTITATSQDGNKKAQCKITVIDAPILLEAGQTIKENVGGTYQLRMEFAETQDKSKLKWESSNPEKISVDPNGLLTMKQAGAAIIKAVYTSGSNKNFTQQCYAVAINPDESAPESTEGKKVHIYDQKDPARDTERINEFLRQWEWNPNEYECLYIPAGVYYIDAVGGYYDQNGAWQFGGIVLTSNQKLVMSESALLVALPNNKGNSQVINITGHKGITVSGGQIIGERKEHKGTGGEWGHGIAVFGGTDITIENVDISQCWGDGIYLGLYNGWEDGNPKKFFSSDITITNCNLHHNRRNNLSITDVSNVTVKNCAFNYASGTDPQYGIDIEPNKGNTCSNVTISDSTFRGNANGTIQILGQLNAHVKGVTIENCKGDKAPVKWSGFGGSVSGVTDKNNNWNWK